MPYGLELYGQLRHLLALVDGNRFKTAHSAEVDDPELGLAPALATALLLTQACYGVSNSIFLLNTSFVGLKVVRILMTIVVCVIVVQIAVIKPRGRGCWRGSCSYNFVYDGAVEVGRRRLGRFARGRQRGLVIPQMRE
ncbi:UNVERIFIED_CONTAM: hypothetical protein ACS92_06330 [Bacillus cereus]